MTWTAPLLELIEALKALDCLQADLASDTNDLPRVD